MPYELFISYSRKDNLPQKPGDAKGWVTALHDEILADHRRFSTEPLRIFFDTSEIKSLDDWRQRMLTGLRESRILLVCLSPNYFSSPPCLWEWEEYLKRQVHALMGQESVAPVYFVEAPNSNEQLNAAWAEAVTRKAIAPADRTEWEKRWKEWHTAVDRHQWVDLKPWFPQGVEALRDAAVRDKLAALGTSLWERIQRARRAIGVPGNLRRLNPHFIGRRIELRQLHENLGLGAVGVVTAINGLGGQGKTELATAYAHGWADSYPAGLWVLGAEGKRELLPLLGELCAELEIPLSASADETADQRGRRVLSELKRRATEVRDPDKGAACLVLLDNVSEPTLLAEPQLAQLPREDWLRVVVTTRLGQDTLPASRQKSLAFIAVDALAEDDAARLIEDHQPDAKWPAATAPADAAAAREIVRELGGFTLAVESVAIYLGLHPDIRHADYVARLRAEGLASVDALPADADVAAEMQHREKQLRLVLDQTLARLTPPERTALDYAALLPPDNIPWPWLRELVAKEHPDALGSRAGYPDPWPALRRRLEGLRLLTLGDHPEVARLHRMVAAHVAQRLAVVDGHAGQRRVALMIERIKSHTEVRCRVLQQSWLRKQSGWEIGILSAIADAWSANEIPEGLVLGDRVAVMKSNLRRYALSESRMLHILSLAGRYPTTVWEIQKFLRFAVDLEISQEDLYARLIEAGAARDGFALIEKAIRSEVSDPHLVYVSKDSILERRFSPIDHIREHLLRESESEGDSEPWMIRVLGYDDDPRGLYDIPEVRIWCQEALAMMPFLPVIVDLQTFQWLAFCLVATEAAGDTGYVKASPIAILELLQQARESLVSLLNQEGIDGAESIGNRCMYRILGGLGFPGLEDEER